MPKYVEYQKIDDEKVDRVMSKLEENQPLYPWTLVAEATTDTDDEAFFRTKILKNLVLKGYIRIKADGKLVVDSRKENYQIEDLYVHDL